MNTVNRTLQVVSLSALLFAALPAIAQHDHHHAPPEEEPAAPAAPATQSPEPEDHSTMDHSTMDHSTMDHSTMDHSTMDHSNGSAAPVTPVPALTDADRAAAFPPLAGHAAHDRGVHSYWLFDELEAWNGDGDDGWAWGLSGWVGGDVDRLWVRSEGEIEGGDLHDASVELLWGHGVDAWWDVVAGVRHDFGEAPSQTFAAFGVQGLAPYKIEVEATAYVGSGGQTALRLGAEYDTLLTNRLILQWHAEADVYGRDDARRGIGSGLSSIEAGLRLRYEITRRFAPYVGIVRERAYGDTADFRRADGGHASDTRFVAGVRFWF